ncbi:MAG: DUF5801 repeats-in-toxin domain-containing protein [Cyanobacteriota bacterium]
MATTSPSPLVDESPGVQAGTNEISLTSFSATATYSSVFASGGALADSAAYITSVAQASTSFLNGASSAEKIYGAVDALSFRLTDPTKIDTGLRTLDGKSILLRALAPVNGIYTFVGFVDADGDGGYDTGEKSAIALIYTPVKNGSKVEGYSVSTTLFDVPIRHLDGSGNPVDYVDMAQLITRDTVVEVTYSNYAAIKSGQNVYIGLKEPIGTSAGGTTSYDLLFTAGATGQTVNTSTTGAGVNNQTTDPGEMLRIDYVTNLKTTYDKSFTSLSYGAHFNVNTGFFFVSQTTPTGGGGQVEISLFNVGADLQGSNFLNSTQSTGYTTVAPLGGKVIGSNGLERTSGVTFTVSGNVLRVNGVKAGDKVVVLGSAAFDRMEIRNPSTATYSFDITSVGGTVADGASALVSAPRIVDDEPTITKLAPLDAGVLAVDDTNLGSGGGDSASTSYKSAFEAAVAAGKDGVVVGDYSLKLASEGAATGLFSVDAAQATGKGAPLFLYTNPSTGAIEAKLSAASTDVWFSVVLGTDVTVTLTQLKNLWHADATNPNDVSVLTAAAGTLQLTAKAIDGDKDVVALSIDFSAGAFSFFDDAPVVTAAATPLVPLFAVDETSLGTDATSTFANLIKDAVSVDFGKDGQASTPYGDFKLVLASANTATGLFALNPAAADGKGTAIVLNQPVAGGTIQGTAGAGGAVMFEIRVNTTSGDVTFDQKNAIWHPDPSSTNEIQAITGLAAGAIKLQAVARDGDRDSAPINVDLSGNGTFTIADDAPGPLSIASTTVPFISGSSVTGAVTLSPGADGFAGYPGYQLPAPFTTVDGRTVTSSVVSNTPTSITIKGQSLEKDGSSKDFYTLVANASSYTCTVNQPLPFLSQLLDFSVVSAGGPKETYTLAPSGLSVTFDGIKYSLTDSQTTAGTFNAKASFDPVLTNATSADDINPNNLGCGVGNGNMDIREGVKLTTPPDSIIGYDLNVQSVGGGIDKVTFFYQAFSGSTKVWSGSQAVSFAATPSTSVRLLSENTKFDSIYFWATGLDNNDVYRINKISALDVRTSPDLTLNFGLQAQDADRDRTNMTTFAVALDNGLAGF